MEILKTDNRELTDVTPIIFETDWVIFYDMKVTGNFATIIVEMVKWNFYFMHKNTKKITFDTSKEIYDMAGNYFVIEYKFESERDSDIRWLKDNFKYDEKEIFAKKIIDNWAIRQVPEYDWKFEYNWKYYLIIWALNKLTDEINPEKWLYKWIIIDYDKYYGLNKNVEAEIKETSDKVDELIK